MTALGHVALCCACKYPWLQSALTLILLECVTEVSLLLPCRYGLIDRIVQAQDAVAIEERNYEAMLAASQSQQRGSSRRAPEGAEAGY